MRQDERRDRRANRQPKLVSGERHRDRSGSLFSAKSPRDRARTRGEQHAVSETKNHAQQEQRRSGTREGQSDCRDSPDQGARAHHDPGAKAVDNGPQNRQTCRVRPIPSGKNVTHGLGRQMVQRHQSGGHDAEGVSNHVSE